MPVSEMQVAALKELLKGNVEKHHRLIDKNDEIEGPDAGSRYSMLIGAGMFEAADQRFYRNDKPAPKSDVISYVASLRGGSESIAEDLNPAVAERVLLAALGQAEIDDLDDETVITTQVWLMAALVADEEYSEEELDAFLARARRTADDWLKS